MNHEDDIVIQDAKDSNGRVYRRISELRAEISRLQIENKQLKLKIERIDTTISEQAIRRAFESAIRNIFPS